MILTKFISKLVGTKVELDHIYDLTDLNRDACGVNPSLQSEAKKSYVFFHVKLKDTEALESKAPGVPIIIMTVELNV